MTPNQFFDKAYCLNLDRRTDRWLTSEKEFKHHNLTVERLPASDWKDIFAGTEYEERYRANVAHLDSFVNFFSKVIAEGTGNVLLFEDDVEFPEDFNERFAEYIEQVPGDWGMLYFGGNHSNGVYNTEHPNVLRCKSSLSTHAIGYRKEAFEYIHYNLEYHLHKIMAVSPPAMYTHVVSADVWLSLLHSVIPTYSFYPALAWQKADYSDIEMKVTDSKHLLKY